MILAFNKRVLPGKPVKLHTIYRLLAPWAQYA
jgi:hypothetical protein